MSGTNADTDSDSETDSGSADSDPGRREVAHRLLAAEFDDASLSYSEGEGDRAPNYVVTPTGARVNRLFVAGVLTETEDVNENTLRARIVDPSGAFVTYAGQYQPDERAFLDRAEPPAFVALTGKARTFRPEDSDRVLTSVRPESVNAVDAETRDRWVVTAAEATLDRLAVLRAAMASSLDGPELRAALADAGVRPALAAGIPRALEHYGTTTAYVEAVRRTATDALAVVAGRREEVSTPDVAPDEGGDAVVGSLPAVDPNVDAALSGVAAGTESDPDAAAAAAGTDAGVASDPDIGPGASGSEPDHAPEPDAGATAGSGPGADPNPEGKSEPDPDPQPEGESEAQPEAELDSDLDPDPEPESEPMSLADGEAANDATTGSETDDVDLDADLGSGIGDFAGADDQGTSDEMYELDEEERRELEEEFGSGFATGNEVDEPGEAGIDVPDADDLESEAPAGTNGSASGEVDIADTDDGADMAPAGSGTASAGDSESHPDPDTESELEPKPEPEPDPDEADGEEADADDESGGNEPAADVDLEDAVVTAMTDLDDGDGADREAVIAAVVDRTGAESSDVEDAIQDALMGGLCYEPGEGTLKAI